MVKACRQGDWLAADGLDSHLGGGRTLICRVVRPDDEGVSVEEISIGEFARRSRSVTEGAPALRRTRRVGAFARSIEASGYRYYDVGQVDEARLVVMLRQLAVAACRDQGTARMRSG